MDSLVPNQSAKVVEGGAHPPFFIKTVYFSRLSDIILQGFLQTREGVEVVATDTEKVFYHRS